jgi:predicted phosphodiesterase
VDPVALRREHGSIDAAARAAGMTRGAFRDLYHQARAGSHLSLVPDIGTTLLEEIPVIHRDYSSQGQHHLYALGDVHKGAKMHDRERWRQWLAYLAETDDVSLLLNGDLLNAAIIGAKSDVYDETLTVGDAKRELTEEVRPLAEQGKIDGANPGNHEDRITRAVGDCPVKDLCWMLGIDYFEASALFVYLVGDVEYKVFVRHGTGNGQSLAGLEKGANVVDADLYITGHTHKVGVTANDVFVLSDDKQRLERRHRYFTSSGSFLALERYAAQRGYAPTRLGAPRIFLDGERRDVRVSV